MADLNKVLPLLEKAVSALDALEKSDISEIRQVNKIILNSSPKHDFSFHKHLGLQYCCQIYLIKTFFQVELMFRGNESI